MGSSANARSCASPRSRRDKKAAAAESRAGGLALSKIRPQSCAANRPSRKAARSRGPPRSIARRARARVRSGTPFSRSRISARKFRVGGEKGDGVVPRGDLVEIEQRRGEPRREHARAGRSHGAIEDRNQRAGPRPGHGAMQFEIGARRGIDLQGSRRRRLGVGSSIAAATISAFVQYRIARLRRPGFPRVSARRSHRGSRRRNSPAGFAARMSPSPAAGPRGLAARRNRSTCERRPSSARIASAATISRGSRRAISAGRPCASVSKTSKSPVEISTAATPNSQSADGSRSADKGHEKIGATGIQQPVFGQSSRRHDAHDCAADDRFGTAFSRFRRILGLFADGDPMAGTIKRCKYSSARSIGTPHIGISSPRCLPRLVSTIPKPLDAISASSKNNS